MATVLKDKKDSVASPNLKFVGKHRGFLKLRTHRNLSNPLVPKPEGQAMYGTGSLKGKAPEAENAGAYDQGKRILVKGYGCKNPKGSN